MHLSIGSSTKRMQSLNILSKNCCRSHVRSQLHLSRRMVAHQQRLCPESVVGDLLLPSSHITAYGQWKRTWIQQIHCNFSKILVRSLTSGRDSIPDIKRAARDYAQTSICSNEERTEQEWMEVTNRFFVANRDWSIDEIVIAEEVIRYWTTVRTPQSAEIAIALYQTCLEQITRQQHQQQSSAIPPILEDDKLRHWYDGSYPRATHLLNAVVDNWRICWAQKQNATSKLPKPNEMLQLLRSWSMFSKEQSGTGLSLDSRTYSLVMTAAVECGDRKEAPLLCEHILNCMLEDAARATGSEAEQVVGRAKVISSAMPDTVTFTTALNAWAKSGRPDAAERAEQLWLEVMQLFEDRVVDDVPNIIMYNTFLESLVNSKQPKHLEKASEILAETMVSPYPDVSPNTTSFRLVLFGYLNAQAKGSARKGMLTKAYNLLHEMIGLYMSGHPDLDLDSSMFSKIIAQLAKSQDQKCLRQAEDIYEGLQVLYSQTRDEKLIPTDLRVQKAMILVYCKLERPSEAQACLDLIESESNGYAGHGYYREVLDAWCQKCDECKGFRPVEEAESVLLRMLHIAIVDGQNDYWPRRQAVEEVLKLWTTSHREDGPTRADALLRTVIKLSEESGRASIIPGSRATASVLQGWAQKSCPESAQSADNLLCAMRSDFNSASREVLRPNRFHYAAVIAGWANSGSPSAPVRCRELFEEIAAGYDETGNDEFRPDTALYGAMLKVYSIARDGDSADGILSHMVKDHLNGNKFALPTTKIFNMGLMAWLRSKDSDAPTRSLRLLELMQLLPQKTGLQVAPDARSYSILVDIMSNATKEEYSKRASDFARKLSRLRSQTK